jgi:dUTP pyrophosphatase
MSAEHTFLIYSQPDCRWCDKAKASITAHGFPFMEIDLTKLEQKHRDAFKAQFEAKDRTVPKIYLNGECIGGYQELEMFFLSPMGAEALKPVVMPPILVQRLSPTAILPARGTPDSIGLDIFANLGLGQVETVPPNEVRKVPCGWAMRAPAGHYLRIAPKSGLALSGLDTLAGVVDIDFTGDVTAIFANHNFENVQIKHGQKMAQIIAERASVCGVMEVAMLPKTTRGEAGFGSTGT